MTLEDAIMLACRAHAGQKDKAGEPYILHCLRVMLQMGTEEERMTAVLHDIVEDTRWKLPDLRNLGAPERVVSTVSVLTRSNGEPYESYIERVARNPLARRVKLADLTDNLNWTRLSNFEDRAAERFGRYIRAYHRLVAATPDSVPRTSEPLDVPGGDK